MAGNKKGLELLNEGHFKAKNPWGTPVVGWKPTSQGEGGLVNPRGFACLRVVHLNESGQPLYDQPLLVESPGAIVVATLGERIALVKNWRPGAARLFDAGGDYVRRLDEEKRWSELTSTLGHWRWEVPRGMLPAESQLRAGESVTDFALRTAKIEANEEAGLSIERAEIVGWLNTNSTFFAHPQAVVRAEITVLGENSPEELEMIGGKKLFLPSEIRELAQDDGVDDGLTMAALWRCGIG